MVMKPTFTLIKQRFVISKVLIYLLFSFYSWRSVSKDFANNEIIEIGLDFNVYDFSIDYGITDTKGRLNID